MRRVSHHNSFQSLNSFRDPISHQIHVVRMAVRKTGSCTDPAQDPLNHARQLMNMPPEPIFADEDGSEKEMPPAKRPKSGKIVENAILGQPSVVVPPQTATLRTMDMVDFSYDRSQPVTNDML